MLGSLDLWGAQIDTLQLGVDAIPVLTWLPVLCCAMIWILLYCGYRYIFMDFIGWRFFSPQLLMHHRREREMPRLIRHKTEKDSFCSKHTIGFSELHTNWIKIIKAGRDITSTRTLTVDITVASIHVISRENDSNLNGIQCKRRLIMYLCCAGWGLRRQ